MANVQNYLHQGNYHAHQKFNVHANEIILQIKKIALNPVKFTAESNKEG